MILKKPFAFLIRKFKIIHLLLTICSIYLMSRVNGLLDFYNRYINGTVGKLEAENYFGNFYVLVSIVSVIICLIVLILMRYKKKSYLFYLIMIGYFIGYALIINYACGGAYDIYIHGLDTKSLLLYRDILKIVSFIQYVFIFMLLVRGLGFDIKKFNFVDDLVELNEDVTDDEEVELTLGGMESVSRKFFRNVREYKYYFLENKYTISILVGVVILGIIGVVFVNNTFLNPIYKVNEVLTYDNFSYKVLNSYVTNIDSNNQKVLSDGETFVLVKLNIFNHSAKEELNTANITLKIGDNAYSSESLISTFSDLGIGYKSQLIDGEATYLLAFKVPVNLINKNMMLLIGKENKIKLNPIFLDVVDDIKNYKIGSVLDLSDTFYEMGNLKILSYDIKDKFDYSYTYEVLGESYEGNISIYSINDIIMNLVIDSSYANGLNDYSFLSRHAKLNYKIGDNEYISRVFENKTPGSYKKGLYLVVDKEIQNAESIWFDIVVRNKHYSYKLK